MWRLAATTGAIGFEIAFCIAIPAFVGHWLDKRFGTQPWIMYIALVVGVGAAIKALVRLTREYKRLTAGQDNDAPPGPH